MLIKSHQVPKGRYVLIKGRYVLMKGRYVLIKGTKLLLKAAWRGHPSGSPRQLERVPS